MHYVIKYVSIYLIRLRKIQKGKKAVSGRVLLIDTTNSNRLINKHYLTISLYTTHYSTTPSLSANPRSNNCNSSHKRIDVITRRTNLHIVQRRGGRDRWWIKVDWIQSPIRKLSKRVLPVIALNWFNWNWIGRCIDYYIIESIDNGALVFMHH